MNFVYDVAEEEKKNEDENEDDGTERPVLGGAGSKARRRERDRVVSLLLRGLAAARGVHCNYTITFFVERKNI